MAASSPPRRLCGWRALGEKELLGHGGLKQQAPLVALDAGPDGCIGP